MDVRDAQGRRRDQPRQRRRNPWTARLLAVAALAAAAGVAVAIVLSTTGGGTSHRHKTASGHGSTSSRPRTSTAQTTGAPGTASVPILAYNVINAVPASSGASPDLYVPTDEFSAQMDALKAGGWHAVTLNQLQAYWTHGTSLGPGKPIVISFDGGYASQFVNALPVLKRVGWIGVVNVDANGRSPADGGLSDSQVHGLISAGWELDAASGSQTDLTGLSDAAARQQITSDRQALQSRYGVPVNWFSYASGRYNLIVTTAVRAAGFVGATTLEAGWASPKEDRFLLPRLRVVGGTSPSTLTSQIDSAQGNAAPPSSSTGV
jgi:peptidoglycan/xylan/chitin deacetylase (PgdA/CDA1 family)